MTENSPPSMTAKDAQDHAKRLAKDPGLEFLVKFRLRALQEETMEQVDPQAIMEAHREYQSLRAFAEWLVEVSNSGLNT